MEIILSSDNIKKILVNYLRIKYHLKESQIKIIRDYNICGEFSIEFEEEEK